MNISIHSLGFCYRRRPVLEGVDLEIPSGALCTLLGANGAGKTTLLKCINGILKPRTGTVRAGDTDLLALSPRQRARLVGYVPQNAQTGDGGLNVLETVLSGRFPYRRGPMGSGDYDAAARILEMFSLGRYALRPLRELSGGERQRVFLARAMAQSPQIMLLDEPTSNLDMYFQQETMEIIRELSSRQGITVITIVHDLNLAAVYADLAVLLHDGTVYASGPPQEILDGERIRAVFGVEAGFAALGEIRYVVPRRKTGGYLRR